MKIKTQDLIGPALDWAAAVAYRHDPKKFIFGRGYHDPAKAHIVTQILVSDGEGGAYDYSPSTTGDTVIDIMEQEGISAMTASGHKGDRKWAAWQGDPPVLASEEITGPTSRIAVCRAFVASKLGDEVNVPEEMMK